MPAPIWVHTLSSEAQQWVWGLCGGDQDSVAILPAPATLEPAKLSLEAFQDYYMKHLSNQEMPKELLLESNPLTTQMQAQFFWTNLKWMSKKLLKSCISSVPY